jgi:hypothetical protein
MPLRGLSSLGRERGTARLPGESARAGRLDGVAGSGLVLEVGQEEAQWRGELGIGSCPRWTGRTGGMKDHRPSYWA